MNKIFTDQGFKDFLYWQYQDKKTFKKILDLLKDIDRNGYKCKGKPEPLKGELSGWWSVRIDEKNRLVFRIENEIIEILKCDTH